MRAILPILLALLAAGPSTAAASWSPPATVSAPHTFVDRLALAAGPAAELAAWSWEDGIGRAQTAGASLAVAAPPGQPFRPQRPLPGGFAGRTVVDLGGGRLAQLILTPRRLNTMAAAVALGRTTGRFAGRQPVTAAVFGVRASLAGDARGDLVLAWIEAGPGGAHRSVWASLRPAGGRFAAPRRLASAAVDALQVTAAAGLRGDAVVAYPSRSGRMLARVRRHGHGWGSQQDLGLAAVGTENDVAPYATPAGRVLVAWYSTQLCSGGCQSPGYTRVAVQSARSGRFAAAQLLERDPIGAAGSPSGRSLPPVVLAIPGHDPWILFLGSAPGPQPGPALVTTTVKVAYPLRAGFAPPQDVSAPGEPATDLAAAAGRHGAIVTWIRGDPPAFEDGTVFAAVRLAATGRLGPPEQVSPSEHVTLARPAFDPASDWPSRPLPPWTVAWVSRPAGSGPGIPLAGIQTLVRAASPDCPLPAATAAEDPACPDA
jgi:hypothetical protein